MIMLLLCDGFQSPKGWKKGGADVIGDGSSERNAVGKPKVASRLAYADGEA